MTTSRVLLCLGLSCGLVSMWDTLVHTWDPTFQAPALRLGRTHTNYHAFREFTLNVGAAAVFLYVMFLPAAQRTRPLWTAMFITAVCYYGGWWLPWALFGLHAPNVPAEIDHEATAILSLTGIVLARRYFPSKVGRAL